MRLRGVGSGRRGPAAPAVQLVVLLGCGLLVLMQVYMGITLAPVVNEDLSSGVAPTALVTAFGLAYAAGFLVFGPLADHYGYRAVLVPGMAALGLSTAAVALAPTLPMLGILRAVQGFAASTFAATALAYVSEALPPRWRTASVGALNTVFLAGGVVGQVYASAVAQAWGWRWAFALAALGFAAATPTLARVLHEPARDATKAGVATRYRQLVTLVRRPDLALLYAATFAVLLAFVAMYTLLGPWLISNFGLHPGGVLLVRSAGLPAMLVAPVAGALVTRVGARRLILYGYATAALGLAGQAVWSQNLAALTLASALFVAGVATVAPALVALIGSRAGAARASAIAIYGFALFAGASLGPLVTNTGLGFAAALVWLAALLAAAAGLVLASRINDFPSLR